MANRWLPRRLYRPLRNVYQRTFNREYWRERESLRHRLRPFVSDGSLAFDVGANLGHVSEALSELGARVVAIEPNPDLADEIRRHYPGIAVEAVAVGRESGTARLRIGTDDAHSTLSEDWARRHPSRWVGELEVKVTTLDALIRAHGVPQFVKVDVEGFESDVLYGLTVAVDSLSFEYQAGMPEVAHDALATVARLGRYEFALAPAGQPLQPWGDADHARRLVDEQARSYPDTYGDIYARRLD